MFSFLVAPLYLAAFLFILLFALKVSINKRASNAGIFLATSVFLIDLICFSLGKILDNKIGHPGGMPWLAKISAIAGLIAFIRYALRDLSLDDIGLRLPCRNKLTVTLLVFSACLAINLWLIRHLSLHHEFSLATFLFMLTLSGVDEEIVFRGVMPSLLMQGQQVGTGEDRARRIIALAAPTALFALVHAWRYTNGQWSFNGYLLCTTGLGSCLLMLLRQKAGSILNTIAVHNALNAAMVVALSVETP